MSASVVFYEPDPSDPTSGPVINTYFGNPENIPDTVATAPIPDGTVIEDVRKWAVQSGQLVNVSYQVDPQEVNAERARRIVTGKDFDISAYGHPTPIHLTGDAEGQMNLLGLAFGAVMRALMDDPTFVARLQSDPTIQPFRDGDNNIHDLNSLQIAMLWASGAAYVSDIIKASWPLKERAIDDTELKDDANWQTTV